MDKPYVTSRDVGASSRAQAGSSAAAGAARGVCGLGQNPDLRGQKVAEELQQEKTTTFSGRTITLKKRATTFSGRTRSFVRL